MSESDFPIKVVAFLDVLGFESLIGKMEGDNNQWRKIYELLSQVHSVKHFSNTPNTTQAELNVSVFSDCIAISSTEDNYVNLLWTVIGLQARLLAEGILIRGGISKGKLIHHEDMLYGPALIRSYKLESTTAIYPRVILDPEVVALMPAQFRLAFLIRDNDGINFLNPFCLGIDPKNSMELFEDGYDTYRVALDQLDEVIKEEIKGLNNITHMAKWEWLKTQLKETITEYDRIGAPRVIALSKAGRKAAKSNHSH